MRATPFKGEPEVWVGYEGAPDRACKEAIRNMLAYLGSTFHPSKDGKVGMTKKQFAALPGATHILRRTTDLGTSETEDLSDEEALLDCMEKPACHNRYSVEVVHFGTDSIAFRPTFSMYETTWPVREMEMKYHVAIHSTDPTPMHIKMATLLRSAFEAPVQPVNLGISGSFSIVVKEGFTEWRKVEKLLWDAGFRPSPS